MVKRTADARALAAKMTDAVGKNAMIEIAEQYDRLAARALERLARQPPSETARMPPLRGLLLSVLAPAACSPACWSSVVQARLGKRSAHGADAHTTPVEPDRSGTL
jgi:hypothetical protein